MICQHCHKQHNDKYNICEHCKIPHDTSRISKRYLKKLKKDAGIAHKTDWWLEPISASRSLLKSCWRLLPKISKIVGIFIGVVILLKSCESIAESSMTGDDIRHGLFLAVMFVWALHYVVTDSHSSTLKAKFKKLGVLTGKTQDDIIRAVGLPNSRSLMADGFLLQWQSTGYHIALMFDSQGVFRYVSHESSY